MPGEITFSTVKCDGERSQIWIQRHRGAWQQWKTLESWHWAAETAWQHLGWWTWAFVPKLFGVSYRETMTDPKSEDLVAERIYLRGDQNNLAEAEIQKRSYLKWYPLMVFLFFVESWLILFQKLHISLLKILQWIKNNGTFQNRLPHLLSLMRRKRKKRIY